MKAFILVVSVFIVLACLLFDPAVADQMSFRELFLYRKRVQQEMARKQAAKNAVAEAAAAVVRIECQASDDAIGQAYSGSVAVTVTGKQCQDWKAQTPHKHSQGRFTAYWNNLGEDVTSASNYCRNPDATSGGLWCYTAESKTRWEYCDVPSCAATEDCQASDDSIGQKYSGSIAVTKSGKTCQNWDAQTPHKHSQGRFTAYWNNLGEDVTSASNYCRNPDDTTGGLWCYTTDSNKRWEFCAVPICA